MKVIAATVLRKAETPHEKNKDTLRTGVSKIRT